MQKKIRPGQSTRDASLNMRAEAAPLQHLKDLVLVVLIPYALGAALLIGGLVIVLPIKLAVWIVQWIGA